MLHPKSWTRWLLGLLVVLSVAGGGAFLAGRSGTAGGPQHAGAGVIRPVASSQGGSRLSLDGGVGWLNTAGPIRLDELRGKIVLLDFWTYCCINCHHVLPDLARLEEKYKNELVVIGVHTAKFYAERDTETIRKKVREYGIKHPVINDANQVLWERFGVQNWPTLVLLDVDGTYLGALSGEGHYAVLDRVIGQLVAKHRARGDLNETPVRFFPEDEKPDNTPLLFPGKVLADAEEKRLFIADTGHNRIVMAGLDGESPQAIGDGAAGLVDGDFAKAEFNRPQGMCLVEETLYVADTENHALRAVDLDAKKVTTVAGTGHQTHNLDAHGPGKTTSLTSPWDVVHVPGTRGLLIAMAGQHQIWRFDLDTKQVGVWAGTGREDIIDGPVADAAFAQPSGLATDGEHVFVADSEVSGIRMISPERKAHVVKSIVGVGLFGFDDVDGRGEEVRLQHCLGIASDNGRLYIADTYNNKIKVCDPRTRSVKTLVGTRDPGDNDNPPRFYQPGGLSVAGTILYVADTNNQKIRAVDLKTLAVSTIALDGLKPPAPEAKAPSFPNAKVIDVTPLKVAPGKTIALDVTVPLAEGSKLNTDVSMPYLVETPEKSGVLADSVSPKGRKIKPAGPKFKIPVELARAAKDGESISLKFSLSAFVCNEGSSVCQVKSYVWNVPITFAEKAKDKVTLGSAKP